MRPRTTSTRWAGWRGQWPQPLAASPASRCRLPAALRWVGVAGATPAVGCALNELAPLCTAKLAAAP
jgi:hypothetical protein